MTPETRSLFEMLEAFSDEALAAQSLDWLCFQIACVDQKEREMYEAWQVGEAILPYLDALIRLAEKHEDRQAWRTYLAQRGDIQTQAAYAEAGWSRACRQRDRLHRRKKEMEDSKPASRPH